jgi:putative hemin transport protein
VSTSSVLDPVELRRRWEAHRQEHPHARVRDVAAALGASEAQLVATACGEGAVRLEPRWNDLLPRFESLGPVTVITRNPSAVHEKKGPWRGTEVSPAHALVVGDAIDLRLFPRVWRIGFSWKQPVRGGERESFQFFDASGTAVLKVFSNPESDLEAFRRLTAEFAAADQSAEQPVSPPSPPRGERPDAEIDVAGFRQAWRELKDTHDFFSLLHTFGVARAQAMRLAEPEMACPVDPSGFRALVTTVASRALPIMVFVGNPGAIQIHTGPVHRVEQMGPWFNVLDPDFNLHVREADIHAAWRVRKPTTDGTVTSLELFDRAGELILQLFGKRKPGLPEDPAWRGVVEETLEPLAARVG